MTTATLFTFGLESTHGNPKIQNSFDFQKKVSCSGGGGGFSFKAELSFTKPVLNQFAFPSASIPTMTFQPSQSVQETKNKASQHIAINHEANKENWDPQRNQYTWQPTSHAAAKAAQPQKRRRVPLADITNTYQQSNNAKPAVVYTGFGLNGQAFIESTLIPIQEQREQPQMKRRSIHADVKSNQENELFRFLPGVSALKPAVSSVTTNKTSSGVLALPKIPKSTVTSTKVRAVTRMR